MPCAIPDFLELIAQLPAVGDHPTDRWTRYEVAGHTFGYLWPRTSTVGLKQTLAEQLALVAERPEVFEVQFTAGAFGWVVVHLEGVERDELGELTFEAWRLTAPADLVAERADELPT
ncbi:MULTISPECIES: MmcQ/YjbR family DNA-binding protein [unclassified Nocardioides]|uniref:MmcQ/YjbR family DNA-binding protein n=1 Tax=unclassified Nocardioides TaxID=2615069 RepID=UPI00361B6281